MAPGDDRLNVYVPPRFITDFGLDQLKKKWLDVFRPWFGTACDSTVSPDTPDTPDTSQPIVPETDLGTSPHYWPADSLGLLRGESLQYLRFSNGSLLGQLRRMEQSGENYRKFLSLYPDISCEPLEFFYQTRRATSALDIHLLRDLLTSFSWREANWGAWLAMWAPRPEYAPLLERRRSRLPHATLVIDLALVSCRGTCVEELKDHLALVQRVREMLDEVRCAPVPLRLGANPDQERQFSREVGVVRDICRSQGVDAAMAMMRTGLIGHYSKTHREWIREGTPVAPPVVG